MTPAELDAIRARDACRIYDSFNLEATNANFRIAALDRCRLLALVDELRAELAALREAAGKVIERWDAPTWKDAEPTAFVINGLRKLLAETVDAAPK